MRIRQSEQEAITLSYAPITARRIVTATMSEQLSVTSMHLDGVHFRTSMGERDVVCCVLSGTGWFQVGDADRFDVEPGDFVFVPHGTSFEYGGVMDYLTVQSPAFRSLRDSHVSDSHLQEGS